MKRICLYLLIIGSGLYAAQEGKLINHYSTILIANSLPCPVKVKLINKGTQGITLAAPASQYTPVLSRDWENNTKWKVIAPAQSIACKVPVDSIIIGSPSLQSVLYTYERSFLLIRMAEKSQRTKVPNKKVTLPLSDQEIKHMASIKLAICKAKNHFKVTTSLKE